MTDYQSLGVRPLINACATMTKYGGSLMPPEVLAAMNEAAKAFVDLGSNCSAASANASPS